MKRQINCIHYLKAVKNTSVYSYDLIGAELNLCKPCNSKLRKEILEQIKLEKECDRLSKVLKPKFPIHSR